MTVLPNSIQKESTIRFRDFRNLTLSFYSLVFFRHFLRMLRLVVFSSKTKSYQEQKTREIAMAKPTKIILNKFCVELSLTLQCTTFGKAQNCNFEKLKDLKQLTIYLHQYFCPFNQSKLKPSLSMKILSINNFTMTLLSKLLSDLSIGVHLKSSL